MCWYYYVVFSLFLWKYQSREFDSPLNEEHKILISHIKRQFIIIIVDEPFTCYFRRCRCIKKLGSPNLSMHLWCSEKYTNLNPPFNFRSRIIDGTTVIQECCKLNPSTPSAILEDNIYRSVESRSFYHTAPITDLAVVDGSKPYLVSAAADGVINVWK